MFFLENSLKTDMKNLNLFKKFAAAATLLVTPALLSAANEKDAYVYRNGTFKLEQSVKNLQNITFTEEGIQINAYGGALQEVVPYGERVEVAFQPFAMTSPNIRFDGSWADGRQMPTASTADGVNHYHYKGFIPTNRNEGTFINFYHDGKKYILGPATKDTRDVGVHIHEIESGKTYNLIRVDEKLPDTYGFVLPTTLGANAGAMLDIDVWMSEKDGAQVKISRIENPKLYVSGSLEGNNWKQEGAVEESQRTYLTETEPGSLVFKGRVKLVQDYGSDKGTFAFFAPRYDEGSWTEQRIGPDLGSQSGTPKAEAKVGEWYTGGFQLHLDRGWIMTPGIYDMTVDLTHSWLAENRLLVEYAAQNVTLNNQGWASFAPSFNALVPTSDPNITVYYAHATGKTNEVAAEPVSTVSGYRVAKAGEGFILKGNAGSEVTFTYSPNQPQNLTGNLLVGVLEDTNRENVSGNVYVLSTKDGDARFYKWVEGTIAANKSYLRLPDSYNTPVITTPDFLSFDNPTAIDQLNQSTTQSDSEVYNLSGQRLQRAQRGVNIVNGKKVLF